jgi:tetratricopeptide (TPR) repeat protein
MPCRRYSWIIVLLCTACASLFHHRSAFEQGLEAYKKGSFTLAAEHFEKYFAEHPTSDTALYYLYDCYKRSEDGSRSVQVLERLVHLEANDVAVYLNLINYYKTHSLCKALFNILTDLPPQFTTTVDSRWLVTRELLATVICGASTKKIYSDPLVFTITEGYMPLFPNGKFYDNDTLTNGQLVVLFDRLLEPAYPGEFRKMDYVTSKSFLYLPYMRLVNRSIIEFDKTFDPSKYSTISYVVKAVSNLKKWGYID